MRSPYSIRRIDKAGLATILSVLKKIASHSEYTECTKSEILDLTHVFVAYCGNQIAGFAGISHYGASWCLRLCAVDPKHRGHGLQRRLVCARVKFIKMRYRSVKYVNVWVDTDNDHSMINLLNEGFRPVYKTPRIFRNTECIKLRKTF